MYSFFLMIALTIWDLFLFHTNFGIFFLFLWKMPLGLWEGSHWLYRWLGVIWIFLTILTLLNHEHRIAFHFFVIFFFIKVVYLTAYISFTSLVSLFLNILLFLMLWWRGLFYPFSDISLLVYRNTPDFFFFSCYLSFSVFQTLNFLLN